MTYPSLIDDVRWLRFSSEVKAKLDLKVTGFNDVFRIADGALMFVVNTNTFNEVFGFYTPLHRVSELGVDGLVDHFVERVKESRKKP